MFWDMTSYLNYLILHRAILEIQSTEQTKIWADWNFSKTEHCPSTYWTQSWDISFKYVLSVAPEVKKREARENYGAALIEYGRTISHLATS